jgi:uncharacterized protein (TIGR03435 family)
MVGLSGSGRLCTRQLPGRAFAAVIVGMLALGVVHAGAQVAGQSDAQPAFEVASVKLAVWGSGPATSDPGMLVLRYWSISMLLMRAYGLQRQRIIAPDWLDSVALDIYAKMPKDSSKEQIPRMLQTLLAERMKLAVHRESRTLPVYELVIGKDGPKMKEVPRSKFIDQILVNNVGPGPRFLRAHLTMPRLADLLSQRLDRCVLDSTGLQAIYDVDLSWAPDQAGALPDAGEPGAAPSPVPPVVATGPDLFAAIQRSLGLKLEARRMPVEVLVVDHVERVPAAN